jgi:HAD superfamily hydrolase (TIGR01509 family)
MRHYLHKEGFGKEIAPDQEDQLIKTLHDRKTDIFIEMIESGQLPLRPGVYRIMQEVNQRRLILGVCTTSAERAAQAIVQHALGDIQLDLVLAGDVVKNKKPDPEIYLLALERTGLAPKACIVFEDSGNGVKAAKSAGMHVVATVNEYTRDENLSPADIVVSCLGDEGAERAELLCSKREFRMDGIVHLSDLISYFER